MDPSDAIAEEEAWEASLDEPHGPLLRAVIDKFRAVTQLTAYHPEPDRKKWPQAPEGEGWLPEGEATRADVLAFPALTTMLHEVEDTAEAMRKHLAQRASRTMLHTCSSY